MEHQSAEQPTPTHHKKSANRAKYGLVLAVVAIVIVGVLGAYLKQSKSSTAMKDDTTQSGDVAGVSTKDDAKVPSDLEPKEYSNNVANFTIHAPLGWRTETDTKGVAYVIFYNKQADQEGAVTSRANINITSQVVNGVTLDQYVGVTKKNIGQALTGYTEIPGQTVSVNGVAGYILEGTYTNNGAKLHTAQLVAVKKNNAYIVTATALDSSWARYQKSINDSMMSLVIKGL